MTDRNFKRTKEDQVSRACDRYQIYINRISQAQTGTVYFYLTAPDGAEVKVRVADHSDVYCNATFSIDPLSNQYPLFVEWAKAHGEKKAAPQRIIYCYLKQDDCVHLSHYSTKKEAVANDPQDGSVLMSRNRGHQWKEVK